MTTYPLLWWHRFDAGVDGFLYDMLTCLHIFSSEVISLFVVGGLSVVDLTSCKAS